MNRRRKVKRYHQRQRCRRIFVALTGVAVVALLITGLIGMEEDREWGAYLFFPAAFLGFIWYMVFVPGALDEPDTINR